MNSNLRKEVASFVSRAIDSSVNYSGKEYDLNRHNWTQITTDRILAAVMNSLPEPIDIRTKYETEGGIFLDKEKIEDPQLDYLAAYQHDQGWNHYFFEYADYLKRLYTAPQPVVQSEHDQNRIHRTSEGDSPNDKEPSQVR